MIGMKRSVAIDVLLSVTESTYDGVQRIVPNRHRTLVALPHQRVDHALAKLDQRHADVAAHLKSGDF